METELQDYDLEVMKSDAFGSGPLKCVNYDTLFCNKWLKNKIYRTGEL